MSDSMPQSGGTLLEGRDSRSPENKDPTGNVWLALTSRGHFSSVSSGPSFDRRIEPCSDPNVVHLLGIPFNCSHQWWLSRVWNLESSGCAPSSSSVPLRGRPLDVYGHHWSVCGRAGVLGTSRVPAGECSSSHLPRGRREGLSQPRVVDLDFHLLPAGQIEVAADGLPVGAALQRAQTPEGKTPTLSLGRPRGGSAFGGVGFAKRRELR